MSDCDQNGETFSKRSVWTGAGNELIEKVVSKQSVVVWHTRAVLHCLLKYLGRKQTECSVTRLADETATLIVFLVCEEGLAIQKSPVSK